MTDANVQAEALKTRLKLTPKRILMSRLLFKLASGFLCAGSSNRDLYSLYGVPDRKLVQFAYSWDYSSFLENADRLRAEKNDFKKELGIPLDKKIILFCGRLAMEKDVSLLLKAYRKVDAENKMLVLVGDGPLKASFEDYIKEHKIESVRFFGFQDRSKISKYYAIADLLVLPSIQETWGIVVSEALCCSLPVIISDQVGSGRDMVKHGQNGYIFPSGDDDSLAGHLNQLIEMPELEIANMGARSHKIMTDWTSQDVSVGLVNYLRSLVDPDDEIANDGRPTVLVCTHYYLPGYKAGGPTRTLSNLVDQLGNQIDFNILTVDRDSGDKTAYPGVSVDDWNRVGKANVYYLSDNSGSFFGLRRVLRREKYDLIHLNSFFSPSFTIKALILRKLRLIPNKPVIIAPRGELSMAALRIKGVKKRIYRYAVKKIGLYNNVNWHASGEREVGDIRREFGSKANILIARDLVIESIHRTDLSRLRPTKISGSLDLVFLSRISRMKNLDGALSMLKGLNGTVNFNIYGPPEDEDYWIECQRQISNLPKNIRVRYFGMVPPDNVGEVFGKHHVFLLPTQGENFGHVIYESLAAGCPVIISDQTPWRDLESKKAGWSIPLNDTERFRSVLQHCIDMDASDLEIHSMHAQQRASLVSQDPSAISDNKNMFLNVLEASARR
jgi:glycosyltransferase involved in cell wall biosynthesis